MAPRTWQETIYVMHATVAAKKISCTYPKVAPGPAGIKTGGEGRLKVHYSGAFSEP